MSFGEVLKKLRTESGLTQQQLADRLNLSKANVSKYESNLVEPNLETIRLITKVFDVDSDLLLEIKSDPIGAEMENLRLARKAKNLTQEDLGKLIGVSESTISLYENGKRQPDYDTLIKIANYFEVSIDYLLGREDNVACNNSSLSPQEKKILSLYRRNSAAKAEIDNILQESEAAAKFGGFAKAVKEKRLERCLTQENVAELCDVSLRHYQNLENGKVVPSLPIAMRLAALLGLSLDKFVNEVNCDELGIYQK